MIRFKALIDFKSREFAGTQYVKDGVYTIRDGNTKLAQYAEKWLKAKRFKPSEDFTIIGMSFSAGVESYALEDDELVTLIQSKVDQGKAEWTETGLISFDVVIPGGTVDGSVTKQVAGGQV